jgi:hypothetical protein
VYDVDFDTLGWITFFECKDGDHQYPAVWGGFEGLVPVLEEVFEV